MALPKIGAAVWQDDIERIHGEHFRDAVVSVFDTSKIVSGKPEVIIDRRPARLQQLRTPTIATEAGQQIAKRAFIAEIELRATDPTIKKDMLLRVHDGGRDPQLELYGFTVTNSVNSSEAAVRNIELITELAVLPRMP